MSKRIIMTDTSRKVSRPVAHMHTHEDAGMRWYSGEVSMPQGIVTVYQDRDLTVFNFIYDEREYRRMLRGSLTINAAIRRAAAFAREMVGKGKVR